LWGSYLSKKKDFKRNLFLTELAKEGVVRPVSLNCRGGNGETLRTRKRGEKKSKKIHSADAFGLYKHDRPQLDQEKVTHPCNTRGEENNGRSLKLPKDHHTLMQKESSSAQSEPKNAKAESQELFAGKQKTDPTPERLEERRLGMSLLKSRGAYSSGKVLTQGEGTGMLHNRKSITRGINTSTDLFRPAREEWGAARRAVKPAGRKRRWRLKRGKIAKHHRGLLQKAFSIT